MNVLALVGPTASGKSDLALRLARESGACLISADSMQVYRGMDIGTAKPTREEQALVPHHLIDLVDPETAFSAADFQQAGRAVLSDHAERRVIVVGGSGLHVRALLDPLEFPPHEPRVRAAINALADDEAVRRLTLVDPSAPIDLANPRRVQRALEIYELTGLTPTERATSDAARAVASYSALIPFVGFGIDPGSALVDRVAARTAGMVEAGIVEEVRSLDGRLGVTAGRATGYGEFGAYLAGEYGLGEAIARTNDATVALAKRQRTYFGRDRRIKWLTWDDDPDVRYVAFRSQLDKLDLWTS